MKHVRRFRFAYRMCLDAGRLTHRDAIRYAVTFVWRTWCDPERSTRPIR